MAKEYVEERNGGYYVAGTRVSLDSIVQCFEEGLSPEAILGEFETLTLTQVYGAIAYYLENQPAIDGYRMRQKQRFEGMRQAAAPIPEGLRQRLSGTERPSNPALGRTDNRLADASSAPHDQLSAAWIAVQGSS